MQGMQVYDVHEVKDGIRRIVFELRDGVDIGVEFTLEELNLLQTQLRIAHQDWREDLRRAEAES